MTEFVYTTYIRSTHQKVWDAITIPEFAHQYWGQKLVPDWKQGSGWDMVRADGSDHVQMTGEVLEIQPHTRLVLSWVSPDSKGDKTEYSRVTCEIETRGDNVRLHVVHDQLKPASEMFRGISDGWPRVLSGLKSFLETGKALSAMTCQESHPAKVA